MQISEQVVRLFLIALPVACISWTVTHEEVFREPRDFCKRKSRSCKLLWQRKFFYLFTCEYCFSHYITIIFLIITKYHLLFADWRGYLIGGFALVWIANLYMSIFGLVRQGVKKESADAEMNELKLKEMKETAEE